MTQIAAEVLERPVEQIRIVAGDTDSVPIPGLRPPAGDLHLVGKAVQIAAESMIGELGERAAALLGTERDRSADIRR